MSDFANIMKGWDKGCLASEVLNKRKVLHL